MTFDKEELQGLRESVGQLGIENLVNIAPDRITVVSEYCPDRFFATIELMCLAKGYGYVLMVEDGYSPVEGDLRFSYGLPVRVSLPDDEWTLKDVFRQALDLLTGVSITVESLRIAIEGLQDLEKACTVLNSKLKDVHATPLFIPRVLARIAARVGAKDPALVELALISHSASKDGDDAMMLDSFITAMEKNR